MSRRSRNHVLKEEPRAVDPPRRFLFRRPERSSDAEAQSYIEQEQICTLKRAHELDAREGWQLLYEIVDEDEPVKLTFEGPVAARSEDE